MNYRLKPADRLLSTLQCKAALLFFALPALLLTALGGCGDNQPADVQVASKSETPKAPEHSGETPSIPSSLLRDKSQPVTSKPEPQKRKKPDSAQPTADEASEDQEDDSWPMPEWLSGTDESLPEPDEADSKAVTRSDTPPPSPAPENQEAPKPVPPTKPTPSPQEDDPQGVTPPPENKEENKETDEVSARREEDEQGRPEIVRCTSRPKWPVPGGSLAILIAVGHSEGIKQLKKPTVTGLGGTPLKRRKMQWLQLPFKMKDRRVAEIIFGPLEAGEHAYEVSITDRQGAEVTRQIHAEVVEPRGPDPLPTDLPAEFTNSMGMSFVLIPSGESVVGSLHEDPDRASRECARGVRIAEPFYLGKYEVTEKEFDQVIVPPNFPARDDSPRKETPLYVAQRFCQTLENRLEEAQAGRSYRLPSGEQWEYACRAGTTTRFHYGNLLTRGLAACEGVYARDVGKFPPNDFGLYDMHGSVREWCSDKTARGGYYDSPVSECRSASKVDKEELDDDDDGYDSCGFRVLCKIGEPRTPRTYPFFNGQDLEGWEHIILSGSRRSHIRPWTVQDGSLIWNVDNAHEQLYHLGRFGDFLLTFKMHYPASTETRLRFRGKLVYDEYGFRVKANYLSLQPSKPGRLEYYVLDEDGLLDKELESPTDEVQDLLKQSWKPRGTNSVALACIGSRLLVNINGIPVYDLDMTERALREGRIAFDTTRYTPLQRLGDGPDDAASTDRKPRLEIRDLRLEPVTDKEQVLRAFEKMIDPGVKKILDMAHAEKIRPKYDLSGVWLDRDKQHADVLYWVEQKGNQVTARYGVLGKALENHFKGVMVDTTVEGTYKAGDEEDEITWKPKNENFGWLYVTFGPSDTDFRRLGISRITQGTIPEKPAFDLSGSWVAKKTGTRYRVSQSGDRYVQLHYVRDGQRVSYEAQGILLGDKCFARFSTSDRRGGRMCWEITDKNTATIHSIFYPSYPPNPSYGTWDDSLKVTRASK